MSDSKPKVVENGVYRHNKTGQLYEVIGVALETETDEQLVIYRQLYKNPAKKYQYELFARPYEMFIEKVELDGRIKPRFEKLDD
ncbi:MAG TPA: DUF1653 domain-containing protein [Candidatus Saccharimonadales bacterium]